MKRILELFTVLMLMCTVACTNKQVNVVGVHCPYSDFEFEAVALRFIDLLPDAFLVLNRTDIFCKDESYFYSYGRKVAGTALWPGSGLARARIQIASDLETYPTVEDGATAHEFLHLYLWDTSDDPCDHEISCGWDESVISEVNNPSE
jgi:hypothetical protein